MSEIAPDMRERLGNIDQIRNILFGNELRDYDARFKRLETELAALRQDTQTNLQNLRESLTTELKNTINSVEKKIQYLSAAADDELATLREQLERSQRDTSTNIAATEQNFKSQLTAVRNDLHDTRDGLQQDIKTFQGYILDELEKRYGNLTEAKVTRDDLAEMLFDVCMRLKGDRAEENGDRYEKASAEYLLPESSPES